MTWWTASQMYESAQQDGRLRGGIPISIGDTDANQRLTAAGRKAENPVRQP